MMAETRRVTVGTERGKNLSNFLTDGMRDIVGAYKCFLNDVTHRPLL